MVSLVTQDDKLKKGDNGLIELHTRPQKYTLPFTIKHARNISEIGTLNDVDPDGNCFFTSLLKAMDDSKNKTESLDLTKHRQMLHSFALKNWKSIVENVLDGGEGDDVKHYFNLSNTKMEIRYLKDDFKKDKAISDIIQKYYVWYKKNVLDRILDQTEPNMNYNSPGVKSSQWGDVRLHVPILALHYKKSIIAYLGGEQGINGTFIAVYNRPKETVTKWYHNGIIFPPNKGFLLIWHNGVNHFNWIKQNHTVVTKKDSIKKQSVLTFVQQPICTNNKQSSRSKDDSAIHSNKKRKITSIEDFQSENKLTKEISVHSTSSQSKIPLSVPTETTNNSTDEQMESESNIETYHTKLKHIKIEYKSWCELVANIKIEYKSWCELVANKRKEYEELTASCNEKCTTTLSNPCEVDKIVKVTRKEKLSTKEDYLIAQYKVDKYHLKD